VISPVVLSALFSQPSCGGLSRRVLYGIVATESSSEPYAIHDDTSGRSYWPRDTQSAATLIVRLRVAQHSYSVGLMQIENSNWPRYRVTGEQLLNPYTNVAIGCNIYRENLYALRGYNTGDLQPSAAGDRYAETVLTQPGVAASTPGLAPGTTAQRPKPAHRFMPRPVAFGFSTPDRAVR
jgi:type IV secretion system protein VirB1